MREDNESRLAILQPRQTASQCCAHSEINMPECTRHQRHHVLRQDLVQDLDDPLDLLHGIVVHERDAHNGVIDVDIWPQLVDERECIEVAISDSGL